jgi:thymidylate kinase
MSVALLGPDGAGKSTLARQVAEGFCFPARTAYMGLWQGDDEVRRGPWRASARVLFRPATSVRRYLAARTQQELGRLVVFDRYTYDAHLPPRPPLVRAKKLYFSLLAHSCPRPGLVLLLDAPGELLAARKREHTAEELEWQRRHFLGLRERLPGLAVVDAARSPEAVKAEILDRIWSHYCARRGKVQVEF